MELGYTKTRIRRKQRDRSSRGSRIVRNNIPVVVVKLYNCLVIHCISQILRRLCGAGRDGIVECGHRCRDFIFRCGRVDRRKRGGLGVRHGLLIGGDVVVSVHAVDRLGGGPLSISQILRRRVHGIAHAGSGRALALAHGDAGGVSTRLGRRAGEGAVAVLGIANLGDAPLREGRGVIARAERGGEGLGAVRRQVARRGADGQGQARGDVAVLAARRRDGRAAGGVGEAVGVGRLQRKFF